MRLLPLLAGLLIASPALADFSYSSTSKTGGAMAAMMPNAPTVSHYYYKGQKMKVETPNATIIMDLDAGTITTLNTSAKTYTVRNMDEAMNPGGKVPDVTIDVRETGQKKTVNGYMASELVMTMEVDPPREGMGKMQMEMDMWISPDVPGAGELRDFNKKNAEKFPWSAMAGGANPSMAKAVATMQRKMAQLNGVTVQSVMRMKSPGGAPGMPPGGMPQMSAAQGAQMQAGMAQARARLEAMIAQGGPGADAAKQALARMGGGVPTPAPSSAAMIEITTDASDFSGGSVPDSVFAIPADYHKAAN
jgi:hypothetical protein